MNNTPDHIQNGDAAREKGDLDGAIRAYGAALKINPDDAMALVNRGVTFQMLGRAPQAAADYARAADLLPGSAQVRANLAAALLDAHRPAEAEAAARAALALDQDHVQGWNNLGIALGQLGRPREAKAAWQQALRLKPDHVSALVNLAQANREADPDGAADLFSQALALAPDHDVAYAECISTLWHACRWTRAQAMLDELDRRLARGMAPQALFPLAYSLPFMADDPARVAKAQRALGAALARSARPLPPQPAKPADAPITIGYLSPDFGNHAMSHVLRAALGAHDHSRFRILLLSLRDRTKDAGPWLDDLKASADKFIDLSMLDSVSATRLIRAEAVDILVDLSGYMAGSRPEILAARPAPVQVYWIGHGGFLEAPYIDYTIADQIVAPDPDGHVERIARLPVCYHPADRFPVSTTPTRAELGLPDTAIVFCAFCNPLKIDPTCFGAWMEILAAVPDSVVWLSGRSAYRAAQETLRQHAEAAGAAGARLIFAPHAVDKSAHLARHRAADLFLDSFNVSAASTALDALSAGLPVLTKRGVQAHANVAASFLTALGMPDLIAKDRADFVAQAIRLARDEPARAALRLRLANALRTEIPFAASRMIGQVEAAYRRMAARSRAGEKPVSFDVPDG